MSARRLLRLVVRGWALQVKELSRSQFELMTAILLPLLFATLAFYVLRAGDRDADLLGASIGAGLMGTWSTVLFGAGSAIDRQRWQGTLELLIAAPAPFLVVLLSLTLATTTVGMYSLAATMAWGALLFDVVRRDKLEALLAKSDLPNSESKLLFNILCTKLFLEEFTP